ncbi:MAG: rhodanese-like domain-containing protein [bacterium]
MRFFKFLRRSEMDQGVERFKQTPGAILLDVRTLEEYADGHVPDSMNIPVEEIERIQSIIPDRTTILFVYCHSGMRAEEAEVRLKEMGYTQIENIGGIVDYTGKVVR